MLLGSPPALLLVVRPIENLERSLLGSVVLSVVLQALRHWRVVVAGGRIHLTFAEFPERTDLDRHCSAVLWLKGKNIISLFRRPLEFADRKRRLSMLNHLRWPASHRHQLFCPFLVGQREDMCRVAVKPAGALRIPSPHRPGDSTVKLLQVWMVRQLRGQLYLPNQLVGGLALANSFDRLVVDELDTVPVRT